MVVLVAAPVDLPQLIRVLTAVLEATALQDVGVVQVVLVIQQLAVLVMVVTASHT